MFKSTCLKFAQYTFPFFEFLGVFYMFFKQKLNFDHFFRIFSTFLEFIKIANLSSHFFVLLFLFCERK